MAGSFQSSYLSLDELAKGNTSPQQYKSVAQQAARVSGADTNKDGIVDASFLEKEMAKGTVGLWAGLSAPEKVSVVAARPQGSAELQSFADKGDVMLDKVMPVVMPMLVSWGFGSGLAGAMGLGSGSLGASAVKAGVGQAVNAAQGGGFDFRNFLLSTLMKTNFKQGG